MYKLLLILKYLRKRRIAWVSLAAVTLCTAMVIVVISVMGGWLRTARDSFRGLMGDIVIQADSLAGFAHYQDVIAEVEKQPQVEAAVPVIQTFGLININNRKTTGVQVFGYPIERIGRVNAFPESLWRQYNQWLEWCEGKPISEADRNRLREVEGLKEIRPGGPLLTLTADERARMAKALSSASATVAGLRDKAEKETDETKKMRLVQDFNRVARAERVMRSFASGRDDTIAGAFDRKEIREAFGERLIDDPDVRLAANDAERKIATEQAKERLKHPSFKPFLPPERYMNAFRALNPRAKAALIEESAKWGGIICGTGVVNIRKDEHGKFVNREDYLYEVPVALTVMGVSANGQFDLGNKAERNYWIVDTSRTKVWQYDSNTVYVPFDVLQKDLGMEEQTAERDGQPIIIPARTKEVHVRVKKPFGESQANLIVLRDRIKQIVRDVLAAKGETAGVVVRTWEESQIKWLGAIEKEMVLVIFLFGIISMVAIFLIFCIFYMIVAEKTRDIGIIKSVGATNAGVAGIFLGYGLVIGIVGAGLGFLIGYLIVHNINAIHDWLGRALHIQVWDPEVYAFDEIPSSMDPVHVTRIIAAAIVASVLGALIPSIRAARMHPVEALRWE